MDKVQQIIELIEKEKDFYEKMIDETSDAGYLFVELFSKEDVLNNILNKIYSFLKQNNNE